VHPEWYPTEHHQFAGQHRDNGKAVVPARIVGLLWALYPRIREYVFRQQRMRQTGKGDCTIMTAMRGNVPKFALGALAFMFFMGTGLLTFPAAAQHAPIVVGGSGAAGVLVDLSVLDGFERQRRSNGQLLFPGTGRLPGRSVTLHPPGTRAKRPLLRAPKRQPRRTAKRPPAPRPAAKITARKTLLPKPAPAARAPEKKSAKVIPPAKPVPAAKTPEKKSAKMSSPAKPLPASRPPRPVTTMAAPPPPVMRSAPPAPAERASIPKAKPAKPPLEAPTAISRGSRKTPPVAAAPRTAVKREKLATAPPPPPPTPPTPTAKAKVKPATQTASLPKEPTSTGFAAGTSHRLMFKSGASTIPAGGEAVLKNIAKALDADPALRLQLRAYAATDGTSASRARRLSLSRALAIRSVLIREQVKATRIDVRALGSKVEDGPPDRVDLAIIAR
jgi:outer membrane protein OmpA-like peptidoglycan-associated protein